MHHFINCQDYDKVDFAGSVESDNYTYLSLLCWKDYETESFVDPSCEVSSEGGGEDDEEGGEGEGCTSFYPYADVTPNMIVRPQEKDNLRISFVALDCAFKETHLANLNSDEMEIFDEQCIDVANGDKAQIRIANPYTYFNITNYASFENIEFTGEDLFAKATYNGESMGFMDELGILAFMPFTKCQVQQDASKLSTIDEITVKTMDFLKVYESWANVDTDEIV